MTKSILDPNPVPHATLLPIPRGHRCEFTLNIGLFFDGTDNNMSYHKDPNTNTNVARLWEAYRETPSEGYFRHYVSGIGTPFTEVDETEAEMAFQGGATGAGGEARVLYGLLQVANSVHVFCTQGKELFDRSQRAALCSDTAVPRPGVDTRYSAPALPAKQQTLKALGRSHGLVDIGEDGRRTFFSQIDSKLRDLVGKSLPVVGAIYVDVFGFSRGAAQARVFVNWLFGTLLHGDQLFGAPASVRMLGLFDTVASVGPTHVLGSHGHWNWASAENLKIHPKVDRCFHVAALHELRANFPLDSVALPDGSLPPNCVEVICPGAHSDVGGGYAPGDQGKAVRLVALDPHFPPPRGGRKAVPDDQSKLSNLPLNWMYDAALKLTRGQPDVPWLELRSGLGLQAKLPIRFGLDRLDKIRQAVAAYFNEVNLPEPAHIRDAVRAHNLAYLAWRYAVTSKKTFEKLGSVDRAEVHRYRGLEFYREGEALLAEQLSLLEPSQGFFGTLVKKDVTERFSARAPEIFKQMKSMRVSGAVATFFDDWVHDSYAGFIGKFRDPSANWAKKLYGQVPHRVAEAERYVRWRGVYAGNNKQLNAKLLPSGSDEAGGHRMA